MACTNTPNGNSLPTPEGIPPIKPGSTPLPLHVEGKYIRDINNKIVILKGVSTPDLHAIYKGHRENPTGPYDPYGASTQAIFNYLETLTLPEWKNVKVVRLCIHPEICDETCRAGGGKHGWLVYNDPVGFFKYIIDPAVQYVKNLGKYVIVDWHYVGESWKKKNEENTVYFWNFISKRYANDSSILFELFNEPGKGRWKDWQSYAQKWINCIRSGDWSIYNLPPTEPADNLILVGAPHWSQKLPHYINFNRSEDPNILLTGSNIAYTCHIYPAHRVPKWFAWTAKYAPAIISEWGYEVNAQLPVKGTFSKWGKKFHDYLNSFDNVGWIAWCFDFIYRSIMFDSSWTLLGNGNTSPGTRYYHGPEDNYENYMGQFVIDWLNEK